MADNFPFSYYVDASIDASLDGTNNGTSQATAKKYWRSALTGSFNYRQGQALLLRPGRFYDVATLGGGMGGIFRSHITVKPWDNGESGNPCLDGRNWITPITDIANTRFTYEGPADGGGHVWSIIVGTQQPVLRVFAASQNNGVLLSQRTLGEGLGTVPDAIDTLASPATLTKVKQYLNADDCWFGAGANLSYKLFMWTPFIAQDPTMYYQGMSFLQYGNGTYGFDVGVLISSTATDHAQDVTVQDIDVLGATGASISVNTTDTFRQINSIRIERCNGKALVRSGIIVRQTPTTAGIATGNSVITDVVARNCTMDGTLSAKEEERTRAYSHFTIADMYTIFDRVDNVVFEDCLAINARHTAFTVGAYSANSTWTRRSGFRRCAAISSEENTYARAFAISMTEDTCFVDQCTFDGMNVGAQAIGSALITNNVFKNARQATRVVGTDTADGHLSIYSNIVDRGTTNIGNERYIYATPVNLRVYNNSFGPLPSKNEPVFTIAAFKDATIPMPFATFPSNTVFIQNNLILDTHPNRKGKPVLSTKVDAGLTLGDIVFDTNLAYKGVGDAPTVTYRGVNTDINATAGFVANLTADPKVDSALRPMQGSPLIGMAKNLATKRRDVTNRERFANTTIGAYESFNKYNRQSR